MNDTWFIPTTWWLRSALGGGVLLLAVWGLTKFTRQPARRQRLSEWGVLAALLAALLSAGPAWLPLRLHLLPEGSTIARSAEDGPTPPSASTPPTLGGEAEANTREPTWADSLPALLFSEEIADSPNEPVSVAPESEPGFSWANAWAVVSSWFSPDRLAIALMTAYLLGAVFLIGRWLLGWLALNRFLRSCTPAPDPVAQDFAEMTRHLRRPPRLLVSQGLRVPVSCGLWRPAVVLPAQLVTPAHASRLRWVFAHELTHLERRDPWSCLLFGLAQGVYFYCPWFWWLRRQVRLCQEFIADAAAARQAGLAEDYAQFLVSLAEAPAGPRVAIGVLGHRSDLFRRITMLLQNPLRIETGCPRRWSLVTAPGLLALAVCASGIGLRAADSEPDKPAPKVQAPAQPVEPANKVETRRIVVVTQDGDKPRVVVVGNGDDLKELREALDKLPPGPEMDKLKKDILKRIKDLKANRPQENVGFTGTAGFTGVGRVTSAGRGHTRLGVMIGQMLPALTEQLDLPKGKGILIAHVLPDHAAAKAGLKDNDILMELAGKAVSSDVREFIKMVNDIKAGTPVDAVVIRKGKEKVVKGITLPEGKDEFRGLTPAIQAVPNPLPAGPGAPGARPFPGRPATVPVPGLPAPGARPVPPLPPNAPLPGAAAAPVFGGFGNNMVMTSIFRTDDRFTGRHQEGSLVITVTGTVTDGKAKLTEIHVQDGKNPEKYDSLSKVPERYRDKTKNLIEMSEKGSVKVETRSGIRSRRQIDNDRQ
jgi:beta-lactamase regulating signal transducer with metallopeptidase domain